MGEFGSKAVAGSGLGLGIAGTALGIMNGGLGNLFGGWNGNCGCSENALVNRYELDLNNQLAAKDARIGLLESNIYTDSKITDTYAVLNGQINALAAEVRANRDAQTAVNMQQAVYNGTNTAAISCIQTQIAALNGLTKLIVPASSVCPAPMPQYNSWTAPTTTG